jgi:hypothetical protein
MGQYSMDIDRILQTLNRHGVDYILIGGVNFLLRHEPIATFDIDFWIEDSDANRARCQEALVELGASWGPDDENWKEVCDLPPNWMTWQAVYCLVSRCGSIDLFRAVKGLGSWAESRQCAQSARTAAGTAYVGLSDEDMLQCQLALAKEERKLDRIRTLQNVLKKDGE